jgi:hypothetical protein
MSNKGAKGDFETRIAKLFREFPAEVYEPDELALIVIKIHLLAENYLDSILELLAQDPQRLALDDNFGFAAKTKLVRAFATFGNDERWPIVETLNTLRNKVAHHFKGSERDGALKNLRLAIIRHNTKNPNALDDPTFESAVLLELAGTLCVSLFVQILHSLTTHSVANRLRMTEPESQGRLFRELCQYLRRECTTLVQRFELLSASFDTGVLEKYLGTTRFNGFASAQNALLEMCLRTTVRLIQPQSGPDPSTVTLAQLFQRANRSRFLSCLKILEKDYVPQFPDRIEPAGQEAYQPTDQDKIREAKKEFWKQLETLSSEWDVLKQKADDFISRLEKWGRFKHLAEQWGGEFESKASEAKLDIRLEIQPIVSMTAKWTADVSKLLDPSGERGADLTIAKTDARAFWDCAPNGQTAQKMEREVL